MDTHSPQNVGRALAEIIHEDLLDRREITLPGWGTFTVEHRGGRTERHDGAVSLHPPKDTVVFQSER